MTEFNPVESLASCKHEFGEHGGVNMSVCSSTTFTVLEADTMPAIFQGRLGPDRGGCYLYSRHFNPTVYVLGRELAAIEGAEAGYCTASGMSAIVSSLMQLCNHGDHIVSSDTVYGGTYALLHDYLPLKTGIEVTFVNIADLEAVQRAMRPNTRVVFTESIANPTLRIANLPRLAEIAHRSGAQLVVDNTFSPLSISPIHCGADVVVHSLTKFINGASDIVAGAVVGHTEFIKSLMDLHTGSLMLLGPTMDPKIAAEINLRLPHLPLRVREHSHRAMQFALRLSELGLKVHYPGLPTHPQHDLARTLIRSEYGFGGLFTLDVDSEQRADELMELLQNKYNFGYMAVSLGYFDTLMSCSSASTSSELAPEDKAKSGISEGLVRFSIGYTGTLEQRWRQLESALAELGIISPSARTPRN